MPFIRRQAPEDIDELDRVLPLVKPKIDPREDRVHCVFDQTIMRLLPTQDVQWFCDTCGSTAKEGYGDTPQHDTKLTHLATPNNPYPTEHDTLVQAVIKDMPTDEERQEQEEYDPSQYTQDRNKRWGMRWYQRNMKMVNNIQDANRLI